MKNIKEYNPGLDILKVLATLMITNSHFIPLYEEHNKALATLGVHGNALFFFVSAFLLVKTLQGKKELFSEWYHKKILQLISPIIVIVLFVSLGSSYRIFDFDLTHLLYRYWFVACFLYSFPLLFLFSRKRKFINLGGYFFSV